RIGGIVTGATVGDLEAEDTVDVGLRGGAVAATTGNRDLRAHEGAGAADRRIVTRATVGHIGTDELAREDGADGEGPVARRIDQDDRRIGRGVADAAVG